MEAVMKLLRHIPRFRKAYRSLDVLAARERWTRQETEAFQLELINSLWNHAVQHVPFYRALKDRRGLPAEFSDLTEFSSRVPTLTKADIKASPMAFRSECAQRGEWWRTGGSTGTPLKVYWAKKAHLEMQQAKYRFYKTWGLDIFARSAFFWGHSASFKSGWEGLISRLYTPLEDRLRNRIRMSAYHLGEADLSSYLRRMKEFRPEMLYGYSQAIHLLAGKALKSGFRQDFLKVIILTGEPAFPHIVEDVEKIFKVPAVVEYGPIEGGIIATEWQDRTLRVREDLTRVETLPRKDGRFDIAISVLNNPSFPLFRYLIGDITDAPLELPSRGFAILKNVSGRNNDILLTRSGRRLHSARFDAFFKYQCRHVRQFQVHQLVDGSLQIAIETNRPEELDKEGISKKIRSLVEGYDVFLEVVETVPQAASGKHRLVTSDLIFRTPARKAARNVPLYH
jgi:phenylacetate-CoA ligase